MARKTEYPKRWTLPQNYSGEVWPDYYQSGFGQSRDSDALERSNFRVALRAFGGESETVQVVREGHWAVGWIEWIAIHSSDREALREAIRLNQKRENYPALNEDDWSELEHEDACETWKLCYDWKERIAFMRDRPSECGTEYRDWRELRAAARGDFFPGYPSSIL